MKIVTLCGSTRFYKHFDQINLKLTLNGWIVLSLGCHTMDDSKIPEVQQQKESLAKVYKQKIALSDYVFVIDPEGYLGESTREEIKFAESLDIEVLYYSHNDLSRLAGEFAEVTQ